MRAVAQVERGRQGAHQQRLGHARDALDQHVAAAQQADQHAGDRGVLADDGLGHLGAQPVQTVAGLRCDARHAVRSLRLVARHSGRPFQLVQLAGQARPVGGRRSGGGPPQNRRDVGGVAAGQRRRPQRRRPGVLAPRVRPARVASRAVAAARSAAAARSRAPARRYSRPWPSTTSAARTTTGSGSLTTGPNRRPRHSTSRPPTTISSQYARAARPGREQVPDGRGAADRAPRHRASAR